MTRSSSPGQSVRSTARKRRLCVCGGGEGGGAGGGGEQGQFYDTHNHVYTP